MSARHTMTALLAVLLFGCASHEGTYSPGCAAFAGDTISLSDGQFVWDKFTDSISLDDEGNVINQFPGYPVQGSYRIEGKLLIMEPASGEALADMYIQQYNGHHYLLTAGQFEAWKNTDEHNTCALVLDQHSED
jgi:hypothetical protein